MAAVPPVSSVAAAALLSSSFGQRGWDALSSVLAAAVTVCTAWRADKELGVGVSSFFRERITKCG